MEKKVKRSSSSYFF